MRTLVILLFHLLTCEPYSAGGTFEVYFWKNHLTVSAILGEVMWVTAASVKWAESESLQQISDQKSTVYD